MVVEPHVVRRRLWRLGLHVGGEAEFKFYEVFFGEDPAKMLRDIEWGLAYLGRYGRQPAKHVEQWEATRFDLWVSIISDFIKAENPKVTEKNETEWS